MQQPRELMRIDEHLADAEISRAIHYLDPDGCAGKTREDASTLVEISIALHTGLTGAITYICLYMRSV